MKPRSSASYSSLLLLPLVFTSAQAAVLGFWNFEANPGVGPNYAPVGTPPTGVTVSPLTAGSGFADGNYGTNQGIAGVGGSRAYVFLASNVGTTAGGALTGAGAGTGPDTFTFTVTAGSGYALQFSQLSLYAWGNANFKAGTYSFFVQSSLTGSTILDSRTITAAEGVTAIGNTTNPTAGNNQYTLDLSAVPELANVTSDVTFTIGVYRSSDAAGNMRFDNFQIEGNIVPEPGGVLLGGLGIGATLMRRKRFPKA
ncbi:MAG: hypothetical protein KF712_18050 [Akkermansiaceae bacterium]|nr:hypothetical protein [Akkermansiaceae bacterium]